MIFKKLYIHNYKSFYHTTIELDKFNIIIGENNSGKSNLIDVLEFLDIAIEKDFYQAVKLKGGFEKILNYNYNEENIIIELELEDNGFLERVRFRVSKDISVISLIIYKIMDNKLLPLHINASRNNKILSKIRDRIFDYQDNIINSNSEKDLFYIQVNFKKNLSYLSNSYAFNTESIRENSHKESIDMLQKDGSNLGKILFEIKKNSPNNFEIISNSMIGIVNEIEEITIQKSVESYNIGFCEPNKEIGINSVSDGTINLLATITALNQYNDKNTLLAFDEPERYLHIKAINYLLDSFRTNKKQIIITTHSTQILKNANLDEIIFIYRDSDGDTQSIRADKIDGLKDMLKELAYDRNLSIDELIADRVIGDFE